MESSFSQVVSEILNTKQYLVAEFNRQVPPEVEQWCIKQFGPCNWDTKDRRWISTHYRIFFSNERDYLLFMLRWMDVQDQ